MKELLRFTTLLFILAGTLILTNCISSPLQGVLFTGTEFNHKGYDTSNKIGPGRVIKRGESCAYNTSLLFGLFFSSDPSLKNAMDDGGITKIAVIDRSSIGVLLNIFARDCIVVWGE